MTITEMITLIARFIHRINDVDISQLCGLAAGTTPATIQTTRPIIAFLFNQQLALAATNNIAPLTSGSAFANIASVPPASPTLTSVAGGAIPQTTYYVQTTYIINGGESAPASEASLLVPVNNLLKVTSPVAGSQGATHYNVYASDATGTETLQNSSPIPIGTDWTEPITGLVSGVAVPVGGSFCWYLVSINLASFGSSAPAEVFVTQGTLNLGSLPQTPANQTAIGAILITTSGTSTFLMGTTAFNGAGVTAAFHDIDCGIAPIFINQAIRTIERRFDFRGMRVRTTYTLLPNTDTFDNPIPYYKKLISCPYGLDSNNKRYPMTKHDIDSVESAFTPTQVGPPALIAEVPQQRTSLLPYQVPDLQWMIRPKADKNYTIIFTAYAYTPDLDGVTFVANYWTINQPDIVLYGALSQAEPYLKEDDRVAMWKQLFDEKLADMIRAEVEEVYAGGSKYAHPAILPTVGAAGQSLTGQGIGGGTARAGSVVRVPEEGTLNDRTTRGNQAQ